MQQTLLSFVALLVATLLSFNQIQANMQSQNQAFRAEIQQMGLGVAMQTMEVIRARAFDAATVGRSSENRASVSEFTNPPFSTGNYCQVFGGGDSCNDVDDFHKMETATVEFPLPESNMKFEVQAEVHYVCSDLERADKGGCTAPTPRKEVVLKVQDQQSDGRSRLSSPIKYSEVIAYP
jgi:hypothetical protein